MRLSIPFNIVINFAGMIFLGMTVFLAWETGSLDLLPTMRGILFLIIGLVLAGVLIGSPLVALHKRYCMGLIKRQQGEISPGTMKNIRFTGTLVMLVQIIVVYFLVDIAFQKLMLGG
jgi:hypothetical protein